MANLPISGLTAGVAVTDTNLFANVQAVGAGPVKTTALQLKTYIGNNLTLTGANLLNPVTINGVAYTWPSANGAAGSVLTNAGNGTLAWTNTALGTVTSVGLSTTVGLTVANSPITSSGTLVINGGILNIANGGTGAATPAAALLNLLPATSPSTAAYALCNDGAGNFYWAAAGGGGGGTAGVMTFSAGSTGFTPTTGASGNVTLAGTLNIASGGTGATTIAGAQANLLPSQAGNAGKYLTTNGSGTLSWAAAAGTGSVTSVAVSGGTTGLTTSGGPITAAGTITIAGILNAASGGTGLNGATAGNGKLLIGNGAGYTLANLTAGAGITITNSAGGITIAATSASGVVSFSGGSTGLTPAAATTGAITLAGTLHIANGGTGLSAVGTSGQALVSNGTALVYGDPARASNLVGGTLGQVPYQSGVSTTAFAGPGAANTYLAGNGTAAPTFKAAQTTLGTTVLTLNNTTTVLNGLTGATMAAAYNPTATQDVATKNYVDNIVSPVNRVAPVAAATTTNLGALSGLLTIDGYTLIAGDRVLVKDQTASQTDGIYIASAGAWTRATDLDAPSEFDSASAFVLNGTVNKNTSWIQTLTVATVGTSPQTWLQQSGIYNYTAGTGISISGTTIDNTGVLTFSGGSTGLTPATGTAGNVVIGGTLNIANGGTSATTAQGARTNILPSQAGNTGKFLTTNGTDVSWTSSAGGAVYYIPLSGSGTMPAAIAGAGYVDAVGNSYVFYNASANDYTLTATAIQNYASFDGCTATSIVVGAGKTMMVSTSVIASTYFIDAANASAGGGAYYVSVSTSNTIQNILSTAVNGEVKNSVYVLANLTSTNVAITNTAGWLNGLSWPNAVSTNTLNIRPNQTVTIQVNVLNTNYSIVSVSDLTMAVAGTFGAATTVAAALPAGTVEQVGMLISLRNTDATSVFAVTGTFTGYQSYAPAAGAASIAVQPGQTLTLRVVTPGSAYYVMNLTSQNQALDIAANVTLTASIAALGLVKGNIVTLTNNTVPVAPSPVGVTLTITAADYGNYESYPTQATATVFNLPYQASVSLQLVSDTASNWRIINYDAPAGIGSVAFGVTGTTAGDVVNPAGAYPANLMKLSNILLNPQNYYDPITGRFTPKVAGYYQVQAYAYNSGSYAYLWAGIYKNGSALFVDTASNTTGYGTSLAVAGVVYLNGTTDYLELQSYWGAIPGGTTAGPKWIAANSGWSAHLTNQTQTKVVGTTAAAVVGKSASQAISNNVSTKLVFAAPAAQEDPQNWWNATNNRFIPTIPGYYEVSVNLAFDSVSAGLFSNSIRKNGSGYVSSGVSSLYGASGVQYPGCGTSVVVYMNGTTDYLEAIGYQATGAAQNTYGNSNTCNFSIALVGANQAVPAVEVTKFASGMQPTSETTVRGQGTVVATAILDNIALRLWSNVGTIGYAAQVYAVSGSTTITGSAMFMSGNNNVTDGWSVPDTTNVPVTITPTSVYQFTNIIMASGGDNILATFKDLSTGYWYRATYALHSNFGGSYCNLERLN